MSVPLWVRELADAFWAEAGEEEPFPRRLRGPLLRTSFDLTIEEVPGLGVRRVERWLAAAGCPRACGGADRPLRACLVAERGGGFIFLDAGDDPAERTFSLAHEVAHFLRDYWQPRLRAVEALGPRILEVLDGERAAGPAERLHALLRRQAVGCHVHLMGRDSDRGSGIDQVERDADRLALELLAPVGEVFARLAPRDGPPEAELLLVGFFGLPPKVAAECAEQLLGRPAPSALTARLKKALQSRRTSPTAREQGEGGCRDE